MTMVAAGKSDGDPPQAWKQDPAQTDCPGAAVLAGLAEQFVDDGLAQRHGGGGVLEEHIQLGEGDGAGWEAVADGGAVNGERVGAGAQQLEGGVEGGKRRGGLVGGRHSGSLLFLAGWGQAA